MTTMDDNNNHNKNIVSLASLAKKAMELTELEFKNRPKIVDPNSNDNTANQESVSIATHFLASASPEFLNSSMARDEDRLVKLGRSIVDLVGSKSSYNKDQVEHGLFHMVQQCEILSQISPDPLHSLKVPKTRFGKTEIQMPVVSLGTMRFQQTWGQNINDIGNVDPRGQDNLLAILRHAIFHLGINHIECARSYGSSELQMGEALKKLMQEEGVKREDLIIQTKVNAMNAKDFRATIDKSFSLLQVDYIDLFSIHGLNLQYHYDLVFHNPSGGENLMDIVREYQDKGKIRYVGFSSHAQPGLIQKCIETGQFDYANIHYHAFGSYTASGGGIYGGNKQVLKQLKERDMGIFIISPFDKGGRLYAPSRKLRSLTLPEMEPIQYGCQWLFTHQDHDLENVAIHTMSVGAARPSDLDEPTVAALLYSSNRKSMTEKVQTVTKRLRDAEIEALGEEWVQTWWQGVRNCETVDDAYQFGQMVWLHNVIKSWGMLHFARDRYETFDANLKKWDFQKPVHENIDKMRVGWGYMPGIAYEPGKDYSKYFEKVPEKNKERVMEAIKFAWQLCSDSIDKSSLHVPEEYETAYDMRPWVEFPKQRY